MMTIQEYMRKRVAEAKKGLRTDLAKMRARPRDIEAEIRCMWKMILES